jgi:hypothetical protein
MISPKSLTASPHALRDHAKTSAGFEGVNMTL